VEEAGVEADTVTLAGFVEGSDDTLNPEFFAAMAVRLDDGEWPVDRPEAAASPDAGIGVRLPRPGQVQVVETERAGLAAATRLLHDLATATRSTPTTIAVEYDGEVIGWISDGQLDESLEVGFLGEWRRALDA
jgi:hypothetical protein